MNLNPAAFFVRRWQFTLLAFALLALLGLNSFNTIPRSEDPHFPMPIMVVRAVLPGASPSEMEQLVAKPIEDAINGLDDLKRISSSSGDNSAVIVVEFGWNGDAERRYDQVVREVNAIRTSLPAGLTRLEVQRQRTTEVAVFQAALVSDTLPMRRLEKVARRMRDRLNRAPGVREAKFWGATPSEVRVALDLGRLAQLKLPASAVSDALRAEGAEVPIGSVHAGERRFDVRSGGAFEDLDRVGDTVVATRAGAPIRVRDVAQVSWANDEARHITRFNGKRALFITATQKDGADINTVTRGIKSILDQEEKTLPGGVKLERAFFQADNVKHRLDRLFRDFGLALALVLLTLLPLGVRAGVVVALSIPLSLLIGLSALQALGFTLNQLSISGMVLSLGLLVDDSIVVTENIARRIREGEDRVSAAINGTGQIAMAVMGCTACLMLAFLPLLALPGGSGGYIKSLPVTVLCTVAASFVVSLTIIPFLASRLLRAHENPEGNALLRAVNGVIHGLYRPVLHASLARPAIALVLIFGLCLTAFPMLKAIGSSLFPPAETPQFLVQVKLPDGSSLARTDEALRFTESRMAKEKDIIWRASNLGRGNPQIYYSLSQREVDPTYAEVYASLKTWVPGRSDALLDRLRRDLASYPGAKIKVVEFMNGPPINAPIEVRLTGENLDVLKALAAHADAILRATPGTRDVDYAMRMDRTDLNLGVDEGKAAVLGVSAGAPRRMARMALSGEDAARYRESDGDDYPVRVRLPMAERNDLAALNQIYVPTADGAAPLSAIATPTLQSSPASISRYNRERFVVVSAYVQSGQLTSAVTSDAFARLKRDLPMPPGYRIALGGQAEAQSEGFAGMGAAVLTAILGILAVLVLEFGRLRIAAVVAAIIPLGMFGAVAALWLTGNSLSFTAAIGIVALIGIEIKNSILLVDFAEGLQREGMGLREAIEKAGEIRFLPVLLTSATAILGLMPLALEHSGLYSPLSIAIIGGLVSSTVLSRVATPVTYLLLAGRRNAKAEAASTTAVSGASA